MSAVTSLLQNAQSHDPRSREPAEAALRSMEESDYASFLSGLGEHMLQESNSVPTRHLAGLLLKNSIDTRNDARQTQLAARWLQLPNDLSTAVKNRTLQCLASKQKDVRTVAAQIVAKIASIDIPNNRWQELLEMLLVNIRKASDVQLKEATLHTLGYVCEECPAQLQPRSSDILSVISESMTPSNPNEIKLASIKALCNALDFARDNMEIPDHQRMIYEMIFVSANSDIDAVRVAAFECLVRVSALYYETLPPFMQNVFDATTAAIKAGPETVALQALEVWSTISDVEADLSYGIEAGEENPNVHKHIIRQVIPGLLPFLLECLTKQEDADFVDPDLFNLAAGAGICLALVAQVVPDIIVDLVLPFVREHIDSSNWRLKDAATLAFGSILEGPSKELLAPLVKAGFLTILNHLKDPTAVVRDTAAWTLGRICKLVPESLDEGNVSQLIVVFQWGLTVEPRIASLVCWSIHSLVEAVPLQTEFYSTLIAALVDVTQRPDADEDKLLSNGYEALNACVEFLPDHLLQMASDVLNMAVSRLEHALSNPGDAMAEQRQALLCGCVQMCVARLGELGDKAMSDRTMGCLLRCLNANNAQTHEEALLACGAMARATKEMFVVYMEHLFPFMYRALQNVDDYQTNQIAIGLVSDLCFSVQKDVITKFADQVVGVFLMNLESEQLNFKVKPFIISCFGDIALATGGFFVRYLHHVMPVLFGAAETDFGPDADYDQVDFLLQLRQRCLETVAAVLTTLHESQQMLEFVKYVDPTMHFLDLIARDQPNSTDDIDRAAVGIIGDLAVGLGKQVQAVMMTPSVRMLLERASSSPNQATQEDAQYSRNAIQRL